MSIPEDLLLVVPPRQRRNGGAYLGYGLAGALLAELLLQNRIVVRGETLSIFDARSTGDEILDQALANIARSSRERSVKWWVTELHRSVKRWREPYIERLQARSTVAAEELKARLRNAVLLPERLEPRVATLAGLCEACRISVVSREEAKHARQRLRDIVRTHVVAAAVAGAVADTEAVMLAVLPAITG